MKTLVFFLVAVHTSSLCGAEPNKLFDTWPGFLGLNAKHASSKAWPTQWSPTAGIAWQAKISGHGQSTPVVWNDRIFVTSVDGATKEKLIVACHALTTGKQLWQRTFQSSNPEKNSVYISRAAPTPIVDASGLYVFFEGGDLLSLDHQGKELWKRSLAEDFGKPKNRFGLSASLTAWNDRIFVLIDDEGPSALLAISKQSGKTLWQSDRASRRSWTSPVVMTLDRQPTVVCSSAGSIDGYDVQSGKRLWSNTNVGGNTGTTPFPVGDGRFLVGASPGRSGENADQARKSNGLVSVKRDQQNWQIDFLWKAEKAYPSWGSPMAHAGCAYWVNRAGVLFCFNLETGKLHYSQRLKQGCWATPVGLGPHVYLFGKEGLTTVVASGPTFQVVAENRLWDEESPPKDDSLAAQEETDPRRRAAAAMFSRPTVYGVAAASNRIVFRVGNRLYCVTGEQKPKRDS